MISQCPQKKRTKQIFFGIIFILILVLMGFFSSPANALWYRPFSPFGVSATSPYLPLPQVPTYPFFTPFGNSLGARPGLPTASVMGSMAPFPNPFAVINSEEEVVPTFLGVTTIFIDPAITLLEKVVVKPLDGEVIKLSAIIPPLTVYIFPSGYIPTAIAPAPIPVPLAPPEPITVVTPTAVAVPPTPITVTIPIPPVTTVVPAAVSGGFFPFRPLFPPIL